MLSLRREADLSIQHAAYAWPEVVVEAINLRDKGLLADAKLVAESGTSAMELTEGISPKGYAVAGNLSPKEPRQANSAVGCSCFACKKPADTDIGGWWATEFEARVLCRVTKAELTMRGWLCGGCRWACRTKSRWALQRSNLWSTSESRKMEIEWLGEAIITSTSLDWDVLFLWVEQC